MQPEHRNDEWRFSDPLRRACLLLLWRAPLLLPLLVVGALICGGSIGWGLVVLALSVAHVLRLRRIFLCSLLCGVAMWSAQALRNERSAALQQLLAEHSGVTLRGTVVRELNRGCILETGWLGVRVALRGDVPFRVGDKVQATVEPAPVPEAVVEGMFSMKEWMRMQGICANLTCLHGEKQGESWGWSRCVRVAEQLRKSLADRLMPPGTEADVRRQVLCALVLGEKERADAETMDIFRRSGCLHAFAVSGLHVGLVAGLLWALLRLLRVHPAVGRYLSLGMVGLYVFATGMAVPALRAYLMLASLLVGLSLRRRPSLFSAWCFAALLVLMVEPWQLWQAGFLLSFVVYAAICLCAHFGMRDAPWFGPDAYIPKRIYTRGERALVAGELMLRGTVLVALSAWLVSLPFIMSQFHVVNAVSYLTNIAIAPLLPLVMLFGLCALMLGAIPLLGAGCCALAMESAGWLVALVSLSGQLPGSYLPACPPAPPEACMIAGMGYGKSFCVLGNPGLVAGSLQREADVRYGIEPALFHAGYTPALVVAGDSFSPESLARLKRSWPQLQAPEPRAGERVLRFSSEAGEFSLYYPPDGRSREPVIIWQKRRGGRIIYMGDAPVSALEALPPDELRADVLVMGSHPGEPLLEPQLLQQMGISRLILLPSARNHPFARQVHPGMRVESLSEEKPVIHLR